MLGETCLTPMDSTSTCCAGPASSSARATYGGVMGALYAYVDLWRHSLNTVGRGWGNVQRLPLQD